MSIRRIFMGFFAHDIGALQPKIITLKQPIQLVGMGIDTDMKRIYRDVPALGNSFENINRSMKSRTENSRGHLRQ
jgi:hypothetical protein